ncbi:MAG: Re/Si-specific NAD(P)(+) transhydrogenase subunit alpha [Planctomycetales bacterium]|nr:Re/Si-specific NAD(P)(+) transhydrogenase subunit alpha [Planctomycetales bacterium]
MRVGVVKETYPGERRVALIPAHVPLLTQAQLEVVVQRDAGTAAGFLDEEYRQQGAAVVESRAEVFAADLVAEVRCLGANQEAGRADLELIRNGQILVGTCDPLGAAPSAQEIAGKGATLFALELIPRITRAQSMDVLSSMATIAGYRAVLLAATALPRMFPMMMTAAGTLSAAKVLVIGAGVAGLQAIATARRLGAVVCAYDVRPAAREQIESLGARCVQLELETADAEGRGGYAKAMDETFYEQQRQQLGQVVAEMDVVVTTAAIPGKTSPLLVTADAVRAMKSGSVIVDLAAERGGNCQLSQADQVCVEHGVTILGPTNLPAEVPFHASQMFSKNVATLLLHLAEGGQFQIDMEDEITRETIAVREGEVTNPRLRDILGLPPLAEPEATAEPEAAPEGLAEREDELPPISLDDDDD